MKSTRTADLARLAELGQQLRVDAVRAADAAGSGHPTSSMSAADLAAVLLAGHLRYDFDKPEHPANDRLILSKGHASPLLYAMYRAAGVVDDEELLTFRKLGSRLEGHPTPRLPWVDVATGSLGQGLPVGVGMALAGKHLDRLPYRVWVLCGDSELAEGSVWEAAEHAGDQHLDNLTLVVDVNRLGQRGPTRHQRDLAAYARRFRAFDWHTVEVDGHDVGAVDAAYREAAGTPRKPTVILAGTVKGKGVASVEDREGLHGKPLPDAVAAVEELGGPRFVHVDVQAPPSA
ncbi:thiamine pyrophosphate-dependent enzyme, partial [Streptomyces sp. YS-3]|uniref:thiamine pyrophosphate-dependent enzyme n=1 Tax=Streptomyces sp. YS-3 TaxID=3381352 RepID=UPI0038624897